MKNKKFYSRFIMAPIAVTFLFVVYCTASFALQQDNVENVLETNMTDITHVETDIMAFVPTTKPAQ